jgi:hypothetical protein
MDRTPVHPVLNGNQAEPSMRDMEQVNDDRLTHKNAIDFEKENMKTAAMGNKKTQRKQTKKSK